MATKRSLEDEQTVDDGIKKIKADGEGGELKTEELMEIRVLVDNYEAAVIIGKGGSNVKNIRTTSSAFISILKNDSATTKERVMTVKGSEAAIAKALQLIVVLLLEASNQRKLTDPKGPGEPETQFTMKILIHKFLAGSIIGKGGCIIREIQESTSARISLSTEPMPGSTEKCVSLTGTPETFNNASIRILNQLATNQLRPGSTTILYVPGAALMGAGMGAPNPFAPPGYPSPYGAPPGGPGSPYGQAPSPYGAPPPGAQHMQHGAPAPGAPYGAQSAYGSPPAQSPYSPYGAPPPQGGAGAPQKTEKIVIPTVCAGTVIGKGGTIIRDIKAQSGSQVSIADPEPTAPGDRVVSVTGTPAGIQTAIFMIRQRVESYQPPNVM